MMKPKNCSLTGLVGVLLTLPAGADVLYSNLKDIAIPANFAGVYLDVDTGNWNTNINAPQTGWDINPFFGGSALWNSPGFQPVRSGTGETAAVVNLAQGSIVNSSSLFSTFTWDDDNNIVTPEVPGYGSSETHLGAGAGQFQAGQEGYLGFRLGGDNYGWMRVVFTNNTGGALIKEWAYETTSNAQIATANIKHSGSTVTLDSTFGAFTVSSAITDVGSPTPTATNLLKTGVGTTALTGTNDYSGTTTVSEGRLNVNGSITSATSVGTGATDAALGGDGTITGGVTIGANGTLLAGQGGTTDRSLTINGNVSTVAGSVLSFTVDAMNDHDQLVISGANSIGLGNADLDVDFDVGLIFTDLGAGEGADFLEAISLNDFSSIGGTWFKLIDGNTTGMFTNTTTLTSGELSYFGLTGTQHAYDDTVSGQRFWLADGATYLVAIPEPRAAMLGGVGLLMLLRRRRS